MMTDPISDMLATIRNGQQANLAKVTTPASKVRENVLAVLKNEGFIREFARKEVRKGIAVIEIQLKYFEGQGAIKEIWRVSTPGLRRFATARTLPKVRNGLGMSILSTSKGMMTDAEARKAGLGGEIICGVF